jgi:two-component system, NtrC family, response regulator AtoC
MLRILVVEDDPNVRTAVAEALGAEGHDVTEVGDGELALERLAATSFDVIVSDVKLPKVDGLAVFREARKLLPRAAVILMTSFANATAAVMAMKQGAHDYLTKPFDVDELVIRVRSIAQTKALEQELAEARARLAGAAGSEIVGASPAIAALLDRLSTVAESDAPVLITGESGTGKELVARRLHALSDRSARPFVAVNCAAFPETLLEAELFGHVRGAFTGAARAREGRFRVAHGGTLLLDEVAEIPLPAQAKLLRVLQDGMFEPLGSDVAVRVDVRIVSATHRDLKRRIAEGTFREDLYYRINAITLRVPPLRERASDLRLLASHFLSRFAPPGKPPPEVSVNAWRALSVYPFMGNVREFAHAIQHAVLLSHGGPIELEHLPEDITRLAASTDASGSEEIRPLVAVVKQAEREHVLHALAVAEGKRSRAAELLGISRKSLWEKLKAAGISDSDIDDTAG